LAFDYLYVDMPAGVRYLSPTIDYAPRERN